MAVSTDYYESLKHRALNTVARAIRDGRIQPASEFNCVDCGTQAEMYEHRDYTRRLDVDPVCRRCNLRRGPAVNAPPDVGKYSRCWDHHDGTAHADNRGFDDIYSVHANIDFDLIDNHIEFLWLFDREPIKEWCLGLSPKKYRSPV